MVDVHGLPLPADTKVLLGLHCELVWWHKHTGGDRCSGKVEVLLVENLNIVEQSPKLFGCLFQSASICFQIASCCIPMNILMQILRPLPLDQYFWGLAETKTAVDLKRATACYPLRLAFLFKTLVLSRDQP